MTGENKEKMKGFGKIKDFIAHKIKDDIQIKFNA
jgi:hypothetical protein